MPIGSLGRLKLFLVLSFLTEGYRWVAFVYVPLTLCLVLFVRQMRL